MVIIILCVKYTAPAGNEETETYVTSNTPAVTPTDHDRKGGNDEQHAGNFSQPPNWEPDGDDGEQWRMPKNTYNHVRTGTDANEYRRSKYDGRDRSPLHKRSRHRRRYTTTDSEEVSFRHV